MPKVSAKPAPAAKEAAIKLPKGIKASDLKSPSAPNSIYKLSSEKFSAALEEWKNKPANKMVQNYEQNHFEIWYVVTTGNKGHWVIPTLEISRKGNDVRTYAVAAENDSNDCYSVGRGPHVKERHTVYIRVARQKDLQVYMDRKNAGLVKANQIRDNRSTKMARGKKSTWWM